MEIKNAATLSSGTAAIHMSLKALNVKDGRNIFDLKDMKDAGIEYYSIGR